jgi:uncharacterized surface protein with fasciclin (FAS1) repeats
MTLINRHAVIAAVLMAVVLLFKPWTATGAAAAVDDTTAAVQTSETTVHTDKKEDPVVLSCQEGDQDDEKTSNRNDDSNLKSEKRQQSHQQQDAVLSTVMEVIAKAPRFLEKFPAALAKANLMNQISGSGPFTVILPLDIAIRDSRWTRVFDNDEEWIMHLRDLLLFHIHIGEIHLFNESVNDDTHGDKGTTIVMANGQELQILRQSQSSQEQRIQFTDQTQSVSQIAHQTARNGHVYMIHTVLMPLSLMYTLDTTFTETTFFYRWLEMADLTHLLQDVENEKNNNDFFTIFAPTNAAFARVNYQYIDFLQSPEGSDKLREVLCYHIVPNHVYYASIHLQQQQHQQQDDGTTIQPAPRTLPTMLNGRDIIAVVINNDENTSISTSTIHLHGDNIARVVVADKLARNGVLHMISNVLLPPHRPAAPTTTTTPTGKATADDDTASTCSSSSSTGRSSVGDHRTSRKKIPVFVLPPTRAAATLLPSPAISSEAPVATSVPVPVPEAAPTPSRVWSLESPTTIDIVNVPIVKYHRPDGGIKLKVILP